MRDIRIVADSTCDLSKELLDKYNIPVIPLMINLGDKSYTDGVDIFPEDIYRWSDETKLTPKTSSASYENVLNVLKPLDNENTDIIFIGISEKMSVNCNTVRLAGEELKHARLFVIDSMNLSTGIGLSVLSAAGMAADGMCAEEIVSKINDLKKNVRASFVVDTLTFLYRGGRCSGVARLVANTLKLKPEIYVENGEMQVGKKYRGKQDSVILKYAMDRKDNLLHADKSMVFITHSGCAQHAIDNVKHFLEELDYFENIYITRAGGVVSSHCGPGTLGVLFIQKN